MHVPSDWTVNVDSCDPPTVKPIYVDGGTSPCFNRSQDRASRTTNPPSSHWRVKSESHTAQHRPSSYTKGSAQQGSQQCIPRTRRVWTQCKQILTSESSMLRRYRSHLTNNPQRLACDLDIP